MTYLEDTWIANPMWPTKCWSVYRQSIRTNNDVEGWHVASTSSQMDSCLSTYWCHYSTKRRHYFPSSGNWYRKESFAADRGKLVNSSESSGCGTSMKTSNFVLVGSSSSVVKSLDQSTNWSKITDWRLYDTILTSPRCYIALCMRIWNIAKWQFTGGVCICGINCVIVNIVYTGASEGIWFWGGEFDR